MNRPQPVYSFDAGRVERLLNRLRDMYRSNKGDDRYNDGIRFGIRSASMAVKEELDLQVINTLSGPYEPPQAARDLLAQIPEDKGLTELSEAMEVHEVSLETLVVAASCEHEFEIVGQLPDGEDAHGNCVNCEVPREFLEWVDWPLGTVACRFCSWGSEDPCGECGRGIWA